MQQGSQDLLGLQAVAQRVTRTLATVGAGLSAGMALRGLVQTGASFEKVMSEVAARTGAVGNDFARLNELAEQLGRSTIFDGDAAGRAMVELSKAGFNVEQIMASVGDVLNLAAADNLELADAAAIVSGALKKFELDASQAGRVADVLASGAGKANTSVAMLGEQLAYAAGPARDAGYSIEETVAAMDILSDKMDKSMAGTAFRQAVLALVKPSAEAKAALDSMGISVFDAQKHFRPLADIVDDFNSKIAPDQRLNVLGGMFEAKAGSAISALLSAGGDELRRLTAEMGNAGGEAGRLAAQMTDNVSGAFTSLMSAVKGFATDTFQLFAGPLKDGLNGLASFITGPVKAAFDSLTSTVDFRPIVGAIAGVVAAGVGLASVSLAFKAIAIAAIPLIAIGRKIAKTYVAVSDSLKLAFSGVRQIGSGISIVMSAAFSRVISAATVMRTAVIARFAAIKVAAVAASAPIGQAFGVVFSGIRVAAGGLHTVIRGLMMSLGTLAAGTLGIGAIVAAPLTLIAGAFAGVMLASTKGVKALKTGWSSLSEHFATIAVQLQATFGSLFNAIVRVGVSVLDALGIKFQTSGSSILDSFNSAMEGLGGWIEGALIDLEFFFDNFESYWDLGMAHLDKWIATASANFTALFTRELPIAAAKGISKLADSLGADSALAKFLGIDTESIKRSADLVVKSFGMFGGGVRPMTDAERDAQSRIDSISSGLSTDYSAFSAGRQAELENKRITAAVERAGKSAWEQMMAGSPTGDLPTSSDNDITPPSTGVAAINDRQGPGIAMRGTQAAFDVINRAIRGSHADQKHKEQIGVLNQIATNTATQPEMPVVASI